MLRQLAPEKVNELFCDRWLSGDRWDHDSQIPLPLASFTMDGLASLPGVEPLGQPGPLVRALSDKTFQYPLFQSAGLPVPDFKILEARQLADCGTTLLANGPRFIQPAFSAGGEQAMLVRSIADLPACLDTLDPEQTVVAARFLPGVLRTLSGNGVVTRRGGVLSLGVTELLQSGFRFDGVILPAFEPAQVQDEMHRLTIQVGELLRGRGYSGFFTADAIRDATGSTYLTEANVRFSGEAAHVAAYCGHNLFDLIAGDTTPSEQVVRRGDDRVVVTKIRPSAGQVVRPFSGPDLDAFLSRETDHFRIAFHREPIQVASGHFVGLAGRRLHAGEGREVALRFYAAARRPMVSPTDRTVQAHR